MFMKRGFTLLELLICLIVLATLAAILFPVFFYVKKNAYKIQTISNLKNLGVAWNMYYQDYDDYVMRGNYGGDNWFGNYKGQSVLDSYVKMKEIKDPSLAYYKFNSVIFWPGYGYNNYLSINDFQNKPSELHISAIKNPSETVCFAPSAGLFVVNKKEELYNVAILSSPSFRFPTFHARYNGNSGVLWVDGHVSNVKAKFLVSNESYKKLNLGEIDKDNDWKTDELFDLN